MTYNTPQRNMLPFHYAGTFHATRAANRFSYAGKTDACHHGLRLLSLLFEGDLHGIMQKRRLQQLTEDTILDWFVQV